METTQNVNTNNGNGKDIAIINTNAMTVASVKQQFDMVHDLYEQIMIKDEHYGMIPGTKKETLYKSGAEKLDLLFKLVPKIDDKIMRELGDCHREVEITIGLYHKETGVFWGQGIGSCSTKETKFRYREGKRLCPECRKDSIIKGKEEYGGGWLCYKKTGGCGQKYKDGDQQIEGQQVGRIENTDIADVYNTVLKMAYKRALVSATITATGVSDIFTQDVEDFTRETSKSSFAEEMEESDRLGKATTKPESKKEKVDPLVQYNNFYNSLNDDLKFSVKNMTDAERYNLFANCHWSIAELDVELTRMQGAA
jgi:hypothetical protein